MFIDRERIIDIDIDLRINSLMADVRGLKILKEHWGEICDKMSAKGIHSIHTSRNIEVDLRTANDDLRIFRVLKRHRMGEERRN